MQSTSNLKLTDQLERELIEREMSEDICHYRYPGGQSSSFAQFFSTIVDLFGTRRIAKA